jgi:hypothetical protein
MHEQDLSLDLTDLLSHSKNHLCPTIPSQVSRPDAE